MPSHACAIAASLFKQITESPSVSDVTTIEYNRWLMENGARDGAFERKKTREEEARLRTAMQDKYKTMGRTSVAELKQQMAMAKAEVEAFQKDNATRGREVKEEVDALLPLLSMPVSACAGDSWARALASTLTSAVARASAPVSPSVSVPSLASVGNGSASGLPAFRIPTPRSGGSSFDLWPTP